MKTKRFLSLAAIFAIALTFFACSSDSPSGPQGQGGESSSNSSEKVYCKLTAGTCSQMSLSTCMELVNAGSAQIVPNCNAEPPPPSSSSVAPPPSSSSVAPPPPSSSSRPSSSSSVVVKTQYYDVVLGNWSTSCPDLNNYTALQNTVISLTDTFITTLQNCLINSETYERNTSTQVANFLATNGLSKYANDFDLKIAASPYDAAYLIYTNVNNYFRVLIIGYSD